MQKRLFWLLSLFIVMSLALAACSGGEPAEEPAPAEEAVEEAAPEEAAEEAAEEEAMEEEAEESSEAMDSGDLVFFSTQFGPIEEQEKFRAILSDGGFDFTASEEGPALDQIIAGAQAGSSEIDVIGALHGAFPPLARENAVMNVIDVLDDLEGDREFASAFVDTGLLGTDDYLHYVPWMQATYIMAANVEALDYLPDGADVNALTWEEFAAWCQNILDETGEARCGLPHAGLFHRFLEGYMFPSFTGGMVSNFRSSEAADMMAWARDTLWPTIHPQSVSYEFMQEPLLSGEVWVAFDHTARLLDAFNTEPDNFVAFPAPAGPAGRGFMPVIVGLGIPEGAADPEASAEVIEFLTRPDVQGAVLESLGFFPVVGGVDTSNLPVGIGIEAEAVNAQATAPDALPALLPVGLGDRGGEINQIFRNAFDRIVLEGEDIAAVLDEEGNNLQALMDETGAPCWAPDPASDGPCQVNAAGAMSAAAMDSGESMAADSDLVFFSTQFGPIEEQEKFRAILSDGGFDFTASEEGPALDQIIAGAQAGSSEIDVIGALHGSFPPLARESAVMNMIDVLDDLEGDREFAGAFIDTGLLGTDDYLHYVPWMQATYIMAANVEALDYLPDGADVNAITWEEFAAWCQNILDETGEARCGLPHAGLFHRFLEGYMFPSFTGGMVSNFRSSEAADMMAWARDTLWPTIHPQSVSYEFMQEPLLSGEVWVAFDHTARLLDAFNTEPDNFVAFPAPAGPAGRGFMPVIVGLGIPEGAADPEASAELIEYLTRPDVQGAVLESLGFFPVVDGVDTSNLPVGIGIEAGAVNAQATAPDALPALLPVGLGDRGGEINQIFRNAFDRIVLEGEEIEAVLAEEGDNLQALMNETGAPCWAPDPASDGPCQVNEAGAMSAAAMDSGESMAADSDLVFFSTQFGPIEEQEKFRAILSEGGFDFTASEEGPALDQIIAGAQAGSSEIDVIGALHGAFPPLAREDAVMNMIDVLDDLEGDREFAGAFIDTGLLGTDDFLHYVPWMQATYIMAANTEALQYLPDGADVNAITWDEFAAWCQNIVDETGEARCGLPHAGLFHRFLEGYMFPSFTGGMVSNFRSEEAAEMMEWARDELWPNIHPQSVSYEFMQEPLLSGEVWVAFDHTARLLDAFNTEPDNFVAFPAPAGPAGRGFMPVIVGLGIPEGAADPEASAELIEFLTRPDVQGAVLENLGFFPVVDGVDTSNLPVGVGIEAGAVNAQATAPDALPALLPVGLGDRGGEINQIFRNAFDRIVLEGEEITSVLNEEGDNLQALMDETGAPCWAPDPASDGPCQVNEAGSASAGGSSSSAVTSDLVFFSTQFGPIEEQEKFRDILSGGGFDFTASEEGPALDQIIAGAQAGSSEIDVVGALHGAFPPLAREDAVMNMIDVLDDLEGDREFAGAFIDTGLLGTDDYLHYVPWMQATYIMAANVEALDYLPDGADVNALTWEEFGEWCANIVDQTGEARCGLPHAGLFHRFLEGYMFPSFTGGMVSEFRSDEAAAMMEWARDELWPNIHPQSVSYEFMQEPLLAGEVWVAFDHTARLLDAFNTEPDNFVAFPAPAGPAGRGFMPVIVGLGIPEGAADPDASAELIEYLTRPDVQGAVLENLGFFPVVDGVDTSNLPVGVGIEAGAVNAQATASDALPALLPVGLGDRGGEINQIFRNAFDRIVLEGEEIEAVLAEEGDNLQALMDETGAPCWAPDPASDGPCQVK